MKNLYAIDKFFWNCEKYFLFQDKIQQNISTTNILRLHGKIDYDNTKILSQTNHRINIFYDSEDRIEKSFCQKILTYLVGKDIDIFKIDSIKLDGLQKSNTLKCSDLKLKIYYKK